MMHLSIKILGPAALLALTLTASPALYAAGSHDSDKPMMGNGGMMGMMNMMGQMSGMMQNCSKMMQSKMGGGGSERPNEQWREKPAADQKKDG